MSIDRVISAAKDGLLLEPETKIILSTLGIQTTTCHQADTPEDAARIAGEIGYPVVLKALSPMLLHKSDTGGVELDLRNPEDVFRAYELIKDRAAKIDPNAGVTVQKMAPKGIEVIVGVTTDYQFGKVIMFGIGGILTELLKDVSFRLPPIDEYDARDMIGSLKSYQLLTGFRGSPSADIDAIVDILLKVSKVVSDHPSIQEMDLNPIIVYPKGAIVVDARARIGT